MSAERKIEKMDPDSPEWVRAANRLARCFAPRIYPCTDCGHPVASGYCCTTCGSADPGRKPDTKGDR